MSDRFPADDEHLHPYPGNLKQHKVMTPDAHSRSYLSALNADYDDAYANKHESTPKFSVGDASKYVDPNTKKMMDDFIKRMNMSLGEAALLGFEQGKKEASHWISVKDRLPSIERVLVYSQYSGVDAGYYQPSIDRWTDSMFFDFVASDCKLFKDVTHWMPLPEPPKE